MKYLIFMVALLALTGCDKNSPAVQDGTGAEPVFLEKPLQGKVSQRGLYRMVRSGGLVDDPDTNTGKVVSNPVIQMIESTDRIPLLKGAQMYLQYRLWPLPNQPAYVDLRRVLYHPAMKLPDGSFSTGSDFKVKRKVSSNNVIVYTGYGFDEDYELVEGDWLFEIWLGDKKLVEQKFTTYWPDEEEVAALMPVLGLGNQVLSKMQSPKNSETRLNWPRVMVGDGVVEVPPGVAEVLSDPTQTDLSR